MSVKSLVAKTYKALRYRHGKAYRIPFGLNRGSLISFHRSTITSIMLGFHEPNTLAVMSSVVEPGNHVVDAGANCGYFCSFLARLVGPTGSVHSFEPQVETFETLTKTIDENCLTNAHASRAAVADTDGITVFFEATNGLISSLDPQWAGDSKRVTVPAVTIDSYVSALAPEIGHIDLIKMDIEGGGVFALRGMKNTIVEMHPVLILESHTPNEDRAIGEALQWGPYDVYRVGSDVPVKYLDRDHRDPFGVYGTVVGIPRSRSYPRFNRSIAELRRFGQR